MGANDNMNKAEMMVVAREMMDEYHGKLKQDLPEMLKPTMYEVSEKVFSRFGALLNVDVGNVESVRGLQEDLNFTRRNRLAVESGKSTIRKAIINFLTITGIAAVLAYLGINIK